ncbi:MAG TPA: hypothetical protein VF559_01970 [Caulobacteraceae bacterium]|jgi:uncharacterized membrane protein
MTPMTWIHIGGGLTALLAGVVGIAARKGGRVHAGAGTLFAAAMIVLGVTATILARLEADTGSGLGGVLVCYFVATSWVTARRRDGATGKFEIVACVLAFGAAAMMAWGALAGAASTPAGPGPIFAVAGVCLIAGALDLHAVLRKKLATAQRLSRHLWRMCFAFFIATGSFFIGQQDVMPAAVRGSPILFVLGFAPLALMLVWLARIRFSKLIARCRPLQAGPAPRAQQI